MPNSIAVTLVLDKTLKMIKEIKNENKTLTDKNGYLQEKYNTMLEKYNSSLEHKVAVESKM